MRIPSGWRETKFVRDMRTGVLQGSNNPSELSPGSRLVSQLIADFYSRAIPEYSHGRLLDLGCGKAPFLGYYSEFVEAATLVDWENSPHASPLLCLSADLNERLPFGDQSFDTVILSDVLEHIATPERLLCDISRILRNDTGILLLNVPFFYAIHEEPYDFHRYTRYSLARMCEKAELHVIELAPMGGLPEILIDLYAKLALHVPIIGPQLAGWIQAFGAALLKLKLFKNASIRSADRFPIGYTLVAKKCKVEARIDGVTLLG